MIDCNAHITVMRCRAFQETLEALKSGPTPNALNLSVTCPAIALTNGTLGQFSVTMNGTLAYNGPTDWAFGGQMSFFGDSRTLWAARPTVRDHERRSAVQPERDRPNCGLGGRYAERGARQARAARLELKSAE